MAAHITKFNRACILIMYRYASYNTRRIHVGNFSDSTPTDRYCCFAGNVSEKETPSDRTPVASVYTTHTCLGIELYLFQTKPLYYVFIVNNSGILIIRFAMNA